MMLKVFKKLRKNNQGAILFMTLMIMTCVLTATLGAANLIMAGTVMSGVQVRSVKAYFAADAGVEKALWEARKNSYNYPGQDTENVFISNINNGSSYDVNYFISSTTVDTIRALTFGSTGKFGNTKRTVEAQIVDY